MRADLANAVGRQDPEVFVERTMRGEGRMCVNRVNHKYRPLGSSRGLVYLIR